MIAEAGATEGWAGFNTAFGASILREAASITSQITGEAIPSDVPDNLAMGIRQPIGVCVGIAPWNGPVILGVRALAMPLACGNTVVFKASEACPAVHRLIGTVLQEAGLPDGSSQSRNNTKDRRVAIRFSIADRMGFTIRRPCCALL
jgi:acyl-CoA reductase-like NAD-dependent aldehyde dehydrogenase